MDKPHGDALLPLGGPQLEPPSSRGGLEAAPRPGSRVGDALRDPSAGGRVAFEAADLGKPLEPMRPRRREDVIEDVRATLQRGGDAAGGAVVFGLPPCAGLAAHETLGGSGIFPPSAFAAHGDALVPMPSGGLLDSEAPPEDAGEPEGGHLFRGALRQCEGALPASAHGARHGDPLAGRDLFAAASSVAAPAPASERM